MSFEVFRLWQTVLLFGEFHKLMIWRGLPEEFVLGEIVPWGLLEFEKLEKDGWQKVAIPDWAITQVYEKTVKRKE